MHKDLKKRESQAKQKSGERAEGTENQTFSGGNGLVLFEKVQGGRCAQGTVSKRAMADDGGRADGKSTGNPSALTLSETEAVFWKRTKLEK